MRVYLGRLEFFEGVVADMFNWKKGADAPAKSDEKAAKGVVAPQPEKAAKFFQHASAMVKSGNFEYALNLFANAIKLDPGNMAFHQAMFEAAKSFLQGGGQAASGKDIKAVDDGVGGNASKLAAAEFIWMRDLNNLPALMKFLEFAGKLSMVELGQWLAPKALNLVRIQQKKKASKSLWIQAKDLFAAVDAWNEAFACGEEAVRLDPSDGKLVTELKQLTAARAIQQGGYNNTIHQEGGFRANIKDADKQRALQEQDSIAAGGDTDLRNLERAKADWEANPAAPENVQKYAMLLRRRGTPEDEAKAQEVYLDGYAKLGEYRFRVAAGDIRIAQARRAVREAEAALAKEPGNEALKQKHKAARDACLELEGAEYADRMEKYPTDRALKMEVGRIWFELGRYEDAMPCFQAAKDEAKCRLNAAHMLGRCFAAEGWHVEAIGEFREALQVLDATGADRELDIRYDLMNSLIEQARAEKSAGPAKEAAEICSAIVRKNIGYRDIREKRKLIDTVIKELGG
jgi:tetratricopeptide (TPR) repeat protein